MSAQVGSTVRLAFLPRGHFSPFLFLLLVAAACADVPDADPSSAEAWEEAGRYIAVIGGCNDCHTDGYLEGGGAMPESEWLTGSAVGWRGPWGTTYPPNLRLTVQNLTEDEWVGLLRTRSAMPPMPWPSVNHMKERDQRALYRYLRALGPAGERRQAALPPGVTPAGPWIDVDVRGLPSAVPADRD